MNLSRSHISLLSGAYFDILNPQQDVIFIEDISHALSNICRFNGHTKFHYSVAQHCVLASYLVPIDHALGALLHDASEAYIGDVASPLKSLLPRYIEIEKEIERVIMDKFDIQYPLHESIKSADLIMLATERRDLINHSDVPWFYVEGINPMIDSIKQWTQKEASTKFTNRFFELRDINNTIKRKHK